MSATNAVNTAVTEILRNLHGNDSQWFWAMAQFVAVLITLMFICRQIRLQRMGNSLTTLAQFASRWSSQEMLEARTAVCRATCDNAPYSSQAAERISSFFEEIGLYVREDVFDLTIVWELYGAYVEHYWPLLRPRIADIQDRDATAYANFEGLHKQIKKLSKKRGAPSEPFSEEQLIEFAREELDRD